MRYGRYLVLVWILLLTFSSSSGAREQSKLFLKASLGADLADFPNLNDELQRQGQTGLRPGIGFSVSLGRTFFQKRWALEVNFGLTRFPSFDYLNQNEDFKGRLTHQDYALIVKYCFHPEGGKFVPYLGAGAGYGQSDLVSGGGRLDAFQGVALFQVHSRLKDNIGFVAECSYWMSFTEERYNAPYLQNFIDDVILDSNGSPLNDRYSALSFRMGVVFWPRKFTSY
ncbi:MAG: hypothetical protein JXB45_10555 [Candidatus Krumholzibacteriota bacterium]|nr:hypothetical protein [Candidatus Krumholzibacteriota bacterium]